MADLEKITASRVTDALIAAQDSDFYSSDGVTWDENADSLYFYGTSDKFKYSLLSEAQKLEFAPKDKEFPFSPEFIELILRIENRLEKNRKAPISRTYPTNIPYSFEDPETGKRVKKYLDLKTASNYELESLVGQIPEALYELLYRSVTGKNNTTE